MIRDIGESVGEAVFETVGRAVSRVQETRPIPADLLESDDAYLVVFDAPGAQAEDVQVRFEDGRVHVRIDRFREFHEGFEMQFPGRGLTLHGTVDLSETPVRAAQSTAELKDNGTLHVRVPKADEEFDSETDDTSSDNGTAADDTGRDGETAIDDT